MTLFASTENSPAEQRALEAELIATFDAVDVTPRGLGGVAGPVTAHAAGSAVPAPPENPDAPARPNWEEPMLWDVA